MAINIDGVNLDTLFDPYVSGERQCPAGEIIYAGEDIRNRYAPLSVGSKGNNVDISIGGVDISNYFAAAGTASYFTTLPWKNENYRAVSSTADSTDVLNARLTMTFNIDGTFQVLAFTEGADPIEHAGSGSFLPVGSTPSNYEVKATVVQGNGLTANTISSYQALTSPQEIEQQVTGAAFSQRSSDVRIDVRKIGTTQVASAIATLTTEVIN